MAKVRLITACDPELLLRHAAAEFLCRKTASTEDPFPTPSSLLVLRQGGLRDDVIRMAAESDVRGWFDPPMCVFHELPEWLGVPSRSVLGEYERFVLVSEILKRQTNGVFSRLARPDEFVDAIDTLFGELISEGVTADAFEQGLEALAGRDEFEIRRDADLAIAYRAYRETLHKLGKGDGRDVWCHVAHTITTGEANVRVALGGRRVVRIFGLADLRWGWNHVLQALAACADLDEIVIYASTVLPIIGIDIVHEVLPETASPATRLFSVDTDSQPSTEVSTCVRMKIIAPDIERELDAVACRVRALIDAGTAPDRIAIVSRKARPYGDRAIRALTKLEVPATARQRIRLREIPVVRALTVLLKAAAEGWTRHGVAQVAQQPYLACDLDARIINIIGYRQRVVGLAGWTQALSDLEREAKSNEAREKGRQNENHLQSLPSASDIAVARDCFAAFVERAAILDVARPLGQWLTWLEDFFEGEEWDLIRRIRVVPSERFDIVRRDGAAITGILKIAREWRTALCEFDTRDEPLGVDDFARQLLPCLESDVALWTSVQRGVNVMEGPAAMYRSFDHVFLVGMDAGSFPTAAPRSSILDDTERDALVSIGVMLDSRDAWETREEELFRLIVAGAKHGLTVSHARLDASGREVIGSAFLEELEDVAAVLTTEIPAYEVILPGVPHYRDADTLSRAQHAAKIERIRADRATSLYNGGVQDAELIAWLGEEFGNDKLWSPTQLEEFAKCPWAYFSKRLLHLERSEDPDQDMDPSIRGTLLHAALAHFYDSAKHEKGGPVFLLSNDWEWAQNLLDQSLDHALTMQQGSWLGHPMLLEAKRAELKRVLRGFVQWEMDLHWNMTDPTTKARNAPKMVRTGVAEHEVTFDDIAYEKDGVRIRYRGSIDRVEVSVDERIPDVLFVAAADYKSTKYSTPGGGSKDAWGEGVALQVPLYAYALAQLKPGYEIARVEYLALKKPEAVHALQLYTYDKKAGEAAQNDDAFEQWQVALNHAIAHVKQVRRGEFPAAPPASCGCPPWCHGQDICRISQREEQ